MLADKKFEKYIFEKLYYPKTGLFYDYLISENPEDTILATPEPEVIAAHAPNPCGYSTGMEDSSLNGGIMLDAVISAYERTGSEEYIRRAVDIYSGLRLCAEAHGCDGYIARSVSPKDGRSVYIDSSRDQFTNWIFGAYRYYASGIATDEHKDSIRRVIVAVAEKHEREVKAENGFELLRLDGKKGKVMRMWGEIEPHEYLRMPMIYLAAYSVSGNEKWKELYKSYRSEGLEKSLDIDCGKLWHTYCALQMQYSVSLLYDLEDDAWYKEQYKALMDKVADYYVSRLAGDCRALTDGKSAVNLCAKYERWDKITAVYTGFIGGLAYYNPRQSKETSDCFYTLRDIGNAATVIALAGKSTKELSEAVYSVMEYVDTDNHYTGGPLDVWSGYTRMLTDLSNKI